MATCTVPAVVLEPASAFPHQHLLLAGEALMSGVLVVAFRLGHAPAASAMVMLSPTPTVVLLAARVGALGAGGELP
jgi:hypothetical protein